jgi:hypothetical protein
MFQTSGNCSKELQVIFLELAISSTYIESWEGDPCELRRVPAFEA